jgi:hypothetical protein
LREEEEIGGVSGFVRISPLMTAKKLQRSPSMKTFLVNSPACADQSQRNTAQHRKLEQLYQKAERSTTTFSVLHKNVDGL